ncbi:MAG: RNA-protein complex protein Nop10 [Promethearchaeota archaeon]
MGKLLRKCNKCEAYTLKQNRCPYCGGSLRMPHPSKFSVIDPYGKYRRMLKKQLMKERE